MYESIVIGAGIEGSSTAYQLAGRGLRVLLIEQFRLPHTQGSSHGSSRITRRAYGPQDYYTNMMKESYELVTQLELECGETLFRRCGFMMIGDRNQPAVTGSRSALERFHVPHEILDISEQKARYPNIVYPDNTRFVLDKSGGVLRSDKMLKAYQDQFVQKGGVIKDGERMVKLTPGPIITVQTDKSTYTARKVVLALGPWAAKFLPSLGINVPLKRLRITVCYWREKTRGEFSADRFPTFLHDQAMGPWAVYGLPSLEYPGLVKICLHHGPTIDPGRPGDADNEWVLQTIKSYVKTHFPTLVSDPELVETCIYTNTPDDDFVLDKHPQWRNIVIGAGFSGHGFKLAPVVGRILADLTEGKQTPYDLSPFKLGRFNKQSHL